MLCVQNIMNKVPIYILSIYLNYEKLEFMVFII